MSKKPKRLYELGCSFIPNPSFMPKFPQEQAKISRPIRTTILSSDSPLENNATQSTNLNSDPEAITNENPFDFEGTPFQDCGNSNPSVHKNIPEEQFVPIFHYYIQKGLKGQSLLLYALICSTIYTSENHLFWGGKSFIANWLGCDEPNANRTIKKLEADGLIIRTGNKGARGTIEYTLPDTEYNYISTLFEEAIIKEYRVYKKKKEINAFDLLTKKEQSSYLLSQSSN